MDRVEALCQIGRNPDHDTCLPIAVNADDRDNPGADADSSFVGERFEIVHRDSRYHAREEFNAAYFFQRLRASRGGSTHCQFLARLTQLAFKLPARLDEARQALGRFLFGSPQKRSDVMQLVSPRVEMMARLGRRLGFDAADAGRDRGFRDDRDNSNIAGAGNMRAAAKLG